MKDLLSIVLIWVYAGSIYRYNAFFLKSASSILSVTTPFGRLGCASVGFLLLAVTSFIDTAFESRLIIGILVAGTLFYIL